MVRRAPAAGKAWPVLGGDRRIYEHAPPSTSIAERPEAGHGSVRTCSQERGRTRKMDAFTDGTLDSPVALGNERRHQQR